MDLSSILILSLFLGIALILILSKLTPTSRNSLPPGPPTVIFLAKFLWGRRSIFDIELILRQLHARYGPIITLRITSHPTVFISDRALAHQALVQSGTACADRPIAVEPNVLLTSNQHDISSSGYGPLWRLLRRNLASETLHPSRVKLFSPAREWSLRLLTDRLRASADGVAVPVEGIEYSMYCLLILMCFGVKPEEEVVKEIEAAERFLLLYFTQFNVFEYFPAITKVLFRKKWNEIVAARMKLHEIFLALSRARQEQRKESSGLAYAYVDSLLELELPAEEGGRRLAEDEIVTLCSEFITAGTDTTTTALQWIMANLVKRQDVQRRLVEEIESVVGREEEVLKEEDLQRMPYLKAVVMEGLRRHPPGHFVLPHAVSEDVKIGGYVIPKGTALNFEIAEMNWDGEAWEEPAEFRPERFYPGGEGEGVDITGGREIRMMSFGAGRRICPGLGVAMLHLEYFVANLVRMFDWKAVEGEEVDMTEYLEFTVRMKNPLRARIIPRMQQDHCS